MDASVVHERPERPETPGLGATATVESPELPETPCLDFGFLALRISEGAPVEGTPLRIFSLTAILAGGFIGAFGAGTFGAGAFGARTLGLDDGTQEALSQPR